MKKHAGFITVFFLTLLSLSSYAQNNSNALLNGFQTPPDAAKPRVWWHWMNGNISKDGIAKDLKWMKRIGIGGFQNFDANLSTPQIVDKRLVYMTPEWKDAFRFTVKLADSLKLEMAIAGSPGWSESGGPWVPAEDGMKKIVWTETHVQGGTPYTGILPKPSSATGLFQNSSLNTTFGISKTLPQYYHDINVIAYRLPETDIPMSELNQKVTSSGGTFNLAQLTDGDISTTNLLPSDTVRGNIWIQFEFDKPQTFKSLSIVTGSLSFLESSDDGKDFRKICNIPTSKVPQQTITFPTTTARFFRITFKSPPASAKGINVAEIKLHKTLRVNKFEEKAAFSTAMDLYSQATPPSEDVIATANVIDLTSKMKEDGTLNWTPPSGNWNIIRFGYSLTGHHNSPASPEATGLEVDKLNPKAVKNYFENYLDQYKNATGGLMGTKGGLQFVITDSWEAGVQNWTNNMMEEFVKRRGYNMLPWMPVLTGHIVKSSEESDNFLWDFRKTLTELVAEYHYDQLTTLLHSRGMKRYTESHESGRAFIADGMEVKRYADIPMSALWTPNENGPIRTVFLADIRESASVAHLYGQNLVAAESLTARGNTWAFSPERLKPVADMELASGLNRFVIHTSVHQPSDVKIPGLGLGPYGQWFTRHETWAELAKPWTTYLARSSYMLQQGKFIADVIYYYGEDNNITALFRNKLPDVPKGYNFDFVNADALLNLLSVKNNQLVTSSGMHYNILALDSNSMQMQLKVLSKISDLVKAGATVVGPKPSGTPSLSDDKAAFNTLVNELWGPVNTVKTIGAGKVYHGQSIQQVLATLKIEPDIEYTKPQINTELLYIHRQLPGKEVYWINNRNDRVENVDVTFRQTGKTVEIWHPETGKVEQASYAFDNGRTKVPLQLEPSDAVFVVFGNATTKTSRTIPQPKETELIYIEGSWNLKFQKERGAPAEITIDKLSSWAENSDQGIKYFSGTGTYSKKFYVTASWIKKDAQLWLDLGEVKNLAEVFVNGKSLGILWKKPFKVNLNNELKPGENTLTVKVTNLWVNRLIGDQQPNTDKKYTYTTMAFYKADSPLLPSGLIGPVRILSVQ